MSRITPFRPAFGQVCTDGPRRTTDLVHERILLLPRPRLCLQENLVVEVARHLIDAQFFERLDWFAHIASILRSRCSALRLQPSAFRLPFPVLRPPSSVFRLPSSIFRLPSLPQAPRGSISWACL